MPRSISPSADTKSASTTIAARVQATLDIVEMWRDGISEEAVKALFEETNEYTKIDIPYSAYLCSGKVLRFFAEQLPNLRELHLQTEAPRNNEITDIDLQIFAQHKSKSMQKMTLNNCSGFSSAALEVFLRDCKGLTEFSTNLFCFGDEHAEALVENRAIKILNITGRNKISSAGLLKIAQEASQLFSLTAVVDVDNPVYDDEIAAAEQLFQNNKIKYTITLV